MKEKHLFSQIDWLLISIVAALSLIGVANIYSATYMQSAHAYQRQLYILAFACALALPVIIVNYSELERFGYVIYALSLLTLVAALLYGHSAGGAQRWISLGFIKFQPSEVAKIAFVIALAKYLSSKPPANKKLGMDFKELIKPAAIFAVPFLLVARQPDLGTALIFMFIFCSTILMVKVRTRVIISAVVAFAATIPLAWTQLKPYQKGRILSFIDPDSDALGSGYHLLQSKIAIGSGGIIGKGFKEGTQGNLRFLPAHHTDFIFSTLAEEWGFIGAILVFILFIVLILRGIDVASDSKDRFGFLVAYGLTAMLFWHVVINIAMVMGLLPVVGVPIPFLSYGGSFLITMILSIAILLNISMRKFTH